MPTQNARGGFDRATAASIILQHVTVHTLTGRDLEQVPEGDRNREVIQLYTLERLYAADGGQAADVISYQSRDWRVTQVQDFDPQGGVFMAFATLVEVTA